MLDRCGSELGWAGKRDSMHRRIKYNTYSNNKLFMNKFEQFTYVGRCILDSKISFLVGYSNEYNNLKFKL